MSEQASGANARPPLDSVRVIAFEQFGAGPWGTMHLADMGPEIITDTGRGRP